MTAPLDPAEALTRTVGDLRLGVICNCRQAGTKPHEGRCNVFILARAALAHARELVPEARSYGGPTDATPDVYRRLQRLPRRDAAAAGRGGGITWEERA